MRTSFTLALSVIAFGLGIADGSAAGVETNQLTNDATAAAIQALAPGQGRGAGFSALRSRAGHALKGEDALQGFSLSGASTEPLAPPDGKHVRGGFAALAASGALTSDARSKEAIAGAPGMARPKGLSALKTAAGHRSTLALEASAQIVPDNDAVKRPDGTNWANGFQSLRR